MHRYNSDMTPYYVGMIRERAGTSPNNIAIANREFVCLSLTTIFGLLEIYILSQWTRKQEPSFNIKFNEFMGIIGT